MSIRSIRQIDRMGNAMSAIGSALSARIREADFDDKTLSREAVAEAIAGLAFALEREGVPGGQAAEILDAADRALHGAGVALESLIESAALERHGVEMMEVARLTRAAVRDAREGQPAGGFDVL